MAGAVEVALLALRHEVLTVILPLEYPGPHADPTEYRDNRAAGVREAVLDAGRDLVIGLPATSPWVMSFLSVAESTASVTFIISFLISL